MREALNSTNMLFNGIGSGLDSYAKFRGDFYNRGYRGYRGYHR